MDADKAARAYPKLEKRIATVLVEHDPSNLFALGAPPDEHDGDVRAIISSLQRATSIEDLDDLCSKMAPAIWEAWREFKRAAG